MLAICELESFQIAVTNNAAGEKLVNAYDLVRALRVARADSNNCAATLRALTATHHLTFGSDSFKLAGANKKYLGSIVNDDADD